MNTLKAVLREVAGLFIEDGALALAIVTVVLLAGICATLIPDIPLVTGTLLLFGCLGVFWANVWRSRGLPVTRDTPPSDGMLAVLHKIATLKDDEELATTDIADADQLWDLGIAASFGFGRYGITPEGKAVLKKSEEVRKSQRSDSTDR